MRLWLSRLERRRINAANRKVKNTNMTRWEQKFLSVKMTENIVSRFSSKLRELSVTRSEKSTLTEMKSLVMSNEKQVLVQIVQSCSLNPVFDCLNSTDDEQIELSCTIIYNLLKNMNSNECLTTYNKLLERALCHPSPRIKTMLLSLLNDIVNSENVVRISKHYPGLLIQASDCIGNSERSVAQGAINLFSTIGMTPEGLQILYSDMLLEKFREVMLLSDTARFRVYEVVSSVSQSTENGLEASKDSGLLNLLLNEVKSTDTLLQLNALEILSSIGSHAHGYNFLQESGIIQYLKDKILKLEDEPLTFVLLPGLIEFFGNICKEDPQAFMKYHPEVINMLFNCLETSDEVLLGVIFSTVGKICSTTNGKIVFTHQQEQMEFFCKRAGQLLTAKNDTTVSVLHSLTELFTVNNGYNDEMNEVLLVWFELIGSDTLDTLIGLTRLPFIELRLAALTLLNAIAKQPWGSEKLCHYPGMTEYLTDRSTEFHKDCKSAKYDIVCSLIDSPNITNIVSDETLDRLKEYVKEGPFYVPTVSPEMMTEGAS